MSAPQELPWGFWVWPEGKTLTRSDVRKKAQEAADLAAQQAVERARKKWLEVELPRAVREVGERAKALDAREKKLRQRELDVEDGESRLARASALRREKEAGAVKDVLAALEAYFEADLDAGQIRERSQALRSA